MEPGVNWYAKRRHYSDQLKPDRAGGRSGHALCGFQIWDEESINAHKRHYRCTDYGNKPIKISGLPECKLCLRAMARRGE